jgi:hypothetical protein
MVHNPQKNMNTQIENGHFVVRIRVSGQQKHLFYKMNTQMRHFKVRPLRKTFAPSFAYLRIHVSDQQNHSLSHGHKIFQLPNFPLTKIRP